MNLDVLLPPSKLKCAKQFSKKYMKIIGSLRTHYSRCSLVFCLSWWSVFKYFIGYCWHCALQFNWKFELFHAWSVLERSLCFAYVYKISALLWYMQKVLSRSTCGGYLPNSTVWVWFCQRGSVWELWQPSKSNRIEDSQVQGSKLPFPEFLLYYLTNCIIQIPESICVPYVWLFWMNFGYVWKLWG